MSERKWVGLEECITRYPRLTRRLQDRMIATVSEAGGCIRDYKNGSDYGSECVSHSGLKCIDQIRLAIKCRHLPIQKQSRSELLVKYSNYCKPAELAS